MKSDRHMRLSARDAEAKKDLDTALALWGELLQAADTPDSRAAAYAGMARVLRGQRRHGESHDVLGKALEDVGEATPVAGELAFHYSALCDWHNAVLWFEKAMGRYAGRVRPADLCKYARALRMLGRSDEARLILNEGLSRLPGTYALHLELAEVALSSRSWPDLMFQVKTLVEICERPETQRSVSADVVPLLYSATRRFMQGLAGQPRRNGVTACVMVKDEARYLLEWIAYYQLLGVDEILVYDNTSTDGTRELLSALEEAGQLRCVDWPDVPLQYMQRSAYDDALLRASTEWITFLDIDEFLVLKRHDSIGEYAASFPAQVGAVSINWRVFGTSGLQHYEDRPTIERFVMCATEDDGMNRHVKTLARVEALRKVRSAHGFQLEAGYTHVNASCGPYRWNERVLEAAQINHYALKSMEEFAVKNVKGHVNLPAGRGKSDSRGGARYLGWFDRNEDQDLTAYSRTGEVVKQMALLRAMIEDAGAAEHLPLSSPLQPA